MKKLDLEEIFELYVKFKNQLKYRNRFRVDEIYDQIFDIIIKNHTIELETDTDFYRARINELEDTYAYQEGEIGMPSSNIISKAGRANPYGINYFYLASDKKTAISEVKPTLSRLVSVGTFRLTSNKRVVCLDDYSSINGTVGDEIDSQTAARFMTYLLVGYTSPIISNDLELEYLPYQYFSEFCKYRGLDGIMYRSATISKENKNYCYVMFSDADFDFVQSSCYRIDGISYETQKYFD